MHDKTVIDALRAALERRPDGAIAVGFSGGMDSTVLLHALAGIPEARASGLRAVHVDHSLHPESATWAQRCAAFAAQIEIPFESVAVVVQVGTGHGLEAAARAARHAALGSLLRGGELLALAHHRDDQAETILLKLLRGAGPEGLGGMRALRQCGKGYLWRPLLDAPRACLLAYATQHGLPWIEDPSNGDLRLSRNFLRREILPRLTQHWPAATTALAHSAAWARHAGDFIAMQAAEALATLRGPDPATLAWRGWLDLPDALRDPVLRLWLRDLKRDEPAHFHVAELERQLRDAAADRNPCVCWDRTEVRRYRDLMHAMQRLDPLPEAWRSVWNGSALRLPCGGSLALLDANGRELKVAGLDVRLRNGGEKLRPAGTAHRRELRLLLQEAGIPPWQRARVPLVFENGELIAAGDVILSDAARVLCARLDARIVWHGGVAQHPLSAD